MRNRPALAALLCACLLTISPVAVAISPSAPVKADAPTTTVCTPPWDPNILTCLLFFLRYCGANVLCWIEHNGGLPDEVCYLIDCPP